MSTVHPPHTTVEALLADGTTVELRPLGPDDHRAVLDLHTEGMSQESRRLRFFGVSRNAPQQAADRLCGPSRTGLLALGAWAGEELVGEADCELLDDPPETAELALAVADRWHHRGVATLLLEHLVHAARAAGVRFFEADTLFGNRAVHQVFFGPLIVLGLGGTAADVLADRTARLSPSSEHDLAAMVSELRIAPLLFGQHGAPAVDRLHRPRRPPHLGPRRHRAEDARLTDRRRDSPHRQASRPVMGPAGGDWNVASRPCTHDAEASRSQWAKWRA
ncbi:GNAT family N-acetyltransferase [Kitasatospora sp. NPDC101155]|uniref:GNAT family N-acetyltransferase n=1 Tax=Kitasatospora sp. NPDC101155 TaxID=3364097 RepID=UPI003804619F